jgi:hypothetical protein
MDTRDAGKLGGNATLNKYGKDYFKELRKKSSGRTKKVKAEAKLGY